MAGFPDFTRIEPSTTAIAIHESALGGAYLSGDLTAPADLDQMGQGRIALQAGGKIDAMLSRVIV